MGRLTSHEKSIQKSRIFVRGVETSAKLTLNFLHSNGTKDWKFKGDERYIMYFHVFSILG